MSIQVFFASPRRLPRASTLPGRVVVLDIAFAADGSGGVSFGTVTEPFVTDLGDRLAAWVDHHDHPRQAEYRRDERFVLATKQEAGACPEMISPELVARVGPVDSVLAHLDLDGIFSAAKWILGGKPPYPEADADAHAVDTRLGEPSSLGRQLDWALRSGYRDQALRFSLLQFLQHGCRRDGPEWEAIREYAEAFAPIAENTAAYAEKFSLQGRVAVVRIPPGSKDLDKTELLLHGQRQAPVAVVLQSGMLTVAAGFDSGFDFPELLGLGGGMPTRATAPEDLLQRLISAINEPD